jgi:outer membrane protein
MKFAPAFLFMLLSLAAFAQPAQPAGNQKVGFADWDYIFSQMPEYKQIESAVKAHGEQLQTQMKAKAQEYETKVDYYQKNGATMLDAVRKDKENELQQLQQNIQKFQQDAQASLQKKQTDLMEPVFKKVGKAIDDVAKENAYTFIINPQLVGGGDILLYQDSKFDISALVLKKMGITVTAAAQPK